MAFSVHKIPALWGQYYWLGLARGVSSKQKKGELEEHGLFSFKLWSLQCGVTYTDYFQEQWDEVFWLEGDGHIFCGPFPVILEFLNY